MQTGQKHGLYCMEIRNKKCHCVPCIHAGNAMTPFVNSPYMEIQPKALATELQRMMAAKKGHRNRIMA